MKLLLRFGLIFALILVFTSAPSVLAVIPPPNKPTSDYLAGTIYFPAWKLNLDTESNDVGWLSIDHLPERKSPLGYYNDGNPEVADWQIKWATEHGINFFIFLMARCEQSGKYACSANLGKPINQDLVPRHEALDDGFLQAGLRGNMKFAMMLNSAPPYTQSINSLEDLRDNLMPYLINNYFKQPNYLLIDNKPVLFIWDKSIINPTEGAEAVNIMRQAAKNSGFTDLVLIGHDWNYANLGDMYASQKLKDYGYDYSFAYTNPIVKTSSETLGNRPTEAQVIQSQKDSFAYQALHSKIPSILTVTPFWNNYPYNYDKNAMQWYLSPQGYKTVIESAKQTMATVQAPLSKKMIILDSWNEYGEGHYIAPDTGKGFAYLQSIRQALTNQDNTPDYRLPSTLGMGPYDSLYQEYRIKHIRPYSEVSQNTYSFSSPDDFVDITDLGFNLEDTNTLTFGFWIKTSLTNDNNIPLRIGQSAQIALKKNGGGHCAIGTTNNAWYSTGTTASWSQGKITPDTWHLITCVYNGSKLHAFVDGKKAGESAILISGTIDRKVARLRLGGYPSSDWNQSSLSKAIFSNTPLTAYQITNLYNTTRPASTPGDLNADGRVDIFDYNLLVQNFGNPYTIFDYNTLVENFGK